MRQHSHVYKIEVPEAVGPSKRLDIGARFLVSVAKEKIKHYFAKFGDIAPVLGLRLVV
jgi:hypothetical protein